MLGHRYVGVTVPALYTLCVKVKRKSTAHTMWMLCYPGSTRLTFF